MYWVKQGKMATGNTAVRIYFKENVTSLFFYQIYVFGIFRILFTAFGFNP